MASYRSYPQSSLLGTLDSLLVCHAKRGHLCVCVTGSGGKTTLIGRLARHWAQDGHRILVTTTTRMAHPANHPYDVERVWIEGKDDGRPVDTAEGSVLLAGTEAAGKLGPLSDPVFRDLSGRSDRILIEADGARGLPLKIHSDRDPVIAPGTDVVISLMGLSAFGKPLDERSMYLFPRFVELTGTHPKAVDEQVYRILLDHPEGVFKRCGILPVIVWCNQSDAVDTAHMSAVADLLAKGGHCRPFTLVMASLHADRLDIVRSLP